MQRQGSVASLASNGQVAELGLERCGAPVVSFGFGGRILLVFPNEARPAYGMDASPYGAPGAEAPSTPSTVHIRKLADLFPPTESTSFPGPIFMDGGKANAGKKRKDGVAWLDQRIGELEQEVSDLQRSVPNGYGMAPVEPSNEQLEKARNVETRLILVKLVKALVENEGKLGGTCVLFLGEGTSEGQPNRLFTPSPKIDEAVRSILVPFTPSSDVSDRDLPLASELAAAAPLTPFTAVSSNAPFTTYAVTPSNLDMITEFLLRGERRKAVKYALDHKLWAHAFVISSCVDTDCWKEVVAEFLRSELVPPIDGSSPGLDGREGLRVAYSMFAGLGGDSGEDSRLGFFAVSMLTFSPSLVLQFVPPRPLAYPSLALPLLAVTPAGGIPRAPTPVSSEPPATNLPDSVLAKWQETVALIVANRTVGDSAALSALGDTLKANGWLDAAHVW